MCDDVVLWFGGANNVWVKETKVYNENTESFQICYQVNFYFCVFVSTRIKKQDFKERNEKVLKFT
jgi:hypothetical protein